MLEWTDENGDIQMVPEEECRTRFARFINGVETIACYETQEEFDAYKDSMIGGW